MKLAVPQEILAQHIAVLGKTGSGKSSAMRYLVEHQLDHKHPVCIIDPKGDWWGLKSSADGKSAGYEVVIFGGEHADVPIDERAWAFFITSWMGRNGSVGTEGHERTATFCIRYTANGGDSATRFRGAVNSIPQWRRRMRNVTILNRDAFGVIEKIADEQGCVIYADPPYIEKGAKYIHDFGPGFMGDDDHARLAKALHRFKKTRVVVSYYLHPRLAELYPGWTLRSVAMPKAMSNANRRGDSDSTAPEVLLINGPSSGTTP